MIGDIIEPTHLLFIFVVALLVLGPKRLPEVGRSLGRGLRDFRQGMQGIEAEARSVFQDVMDEPKASATHTSTEYSPVTPAAPAPHFVLGAKTEGEPTSTSSPAQSAGTATAVATGQPAPNLED